MPSKHFHKLLDQMREIHDRKSHDYSDDANPFSNFTISADLVKHYKNPIDQVFVGIISIKLARLSELLNGKEAKNESINDSFIDLANYCALWGSYYLSLEDKERQDILDEIAKPVFSDPLDNKSNLFPNKCSKCNSGTLEANINHAIMMHLALFIAPNVLTYPDGKGLDLTMYILDKQIKEDLDIPL